MSGAVDVLQQFANDDLFDAELGEDSDGGDQNGRSSEDESASKSPAHDWMDKENEDNSDGEAANSGSDEDATPEKEKRQRRRESRKKSPKPRKAKKMAELMSLHSESQRMVRESIVRLPYHSPTVLPISHFLKRVPLTDQKKSERRPQVVASASPPESQTSPASDGKPGDQELTSPMLGDTASPTGDGNGVKGVAKAATPKLSAATDPFFLDTDVTPSSSKPVNSGVQSLRERFMKHTSKPQDKSMAPIKPTETKDNQTDEAVIETTPKPRGGTPVVSDDKLKSATPGSRLQLLKEQLAEKMKVKRAEIRKIQESQRKLDNEEMSEEEEEEITDEEDDSDYELDKWNEVDDRRQEEGDSEEETKDKNAFVDDEADESDNGDDVDNNRYDIDSGSEGDISDGGESDNSADENSVFSDDGLSASTSNCKSRKKQKKSKQSTVNPEEQTMDLFCDSRSKGAESDEPLLQNSNTEKDSGESMASLCLRLDSLEDGDDTNFNFPSLPVATKLINKTKTSSKPDKNLTNISEVSQESSQSSFGGGLGSEFGESANSLEASSDSSRIPPGQGDNNAQGNDDRSSGKKTPEPFSSFSRLRNLIGMTSDGDSHSFRKPGKLSQLTLPIEDSQDLFDNDSDRNVEDHNSEQDRTRPEVMSNDFHFSLDEDTQFTQILNTQGFLNSSKKSTKSKTKKLFDDDMSSSTQPQMKELLGLCSGVFSDSDDTRTAKDAETQDDAKGHQKADVMFDAQSNQFNMNELLGLCSGKFTDNDDKIEDDVSKGKENDFEKSDSELGEQAGRGDDEDNDRKSEDEAESDPEEMIIKRKYGKKYEAKKSIIFDKMNFLEEEAELSGSDVGSDEDEDIATDDDVLEADSGGEELPSDEELQNQINKVHMKSVHDQDNADLRAVKEMFLPDGDLYTDGQGRARHFRWRGIDENSQFDLFGNKELWGDDEAETAELTTEEEIQRRKERYEREAFLREEMGKQDIDMLDIDENSQIILNKIKDTSSQLQEAPTKPQAMIINPKNNVHVAPVLKKKTSFKGSFLKHSKTTLSRLSSLTSNTPNASATTRGFVFQTVSPSSKNNSNTKKMQRANSTIEQPASKKPRLDRSLSDSNSVFSML